MITIARMLRHALEDGFIFGPAPCTGDYQPSLVPEYSDATLKGDREIPSGAAFIHPSYHNGGVL